MCSQARKVRSLEKKTLGSTFTVSGAADAAAFLPSSFFEPNQLPVTDTSGAPPHTPSVSRPPLTDQHRRPTSAGLLFH
jgi:hypothetical protein